MTIVKFKSKGASALESFVRDFEAGKISDAVIVMCKDDELTFLPITESPLYYLGWLCLECTHSILHYDEESDDE